MPSPNLPSRYEAQHYHCSRLAVLGRHINAGEPIAPVQRAAIMIQFGGNGALRNRTRGGDT
jgi:hypothetical protein